MNNKHASSGPVGSIGASPTRLMGLALSCLVFLGASLSTRASDPVGVFAVIDKVVLEPAKGPAERIQVWGTFTIAGETRTVVYHPPKQGYLYYTLPAEKPEVARIEWSDLKKMAGTGEVIGFGARRVRSGKLANNGTVRNDKAKPEKPDVYQLGYGLVRMKNRPTKYRPIQDTLAAAQGKKKAEKKQP